MLCEVPKGKLPVSASEYSATGVLTKLPKEVLLWEAFLAGGSRKLY